MVMAGDLLHLRLEGSNVAHDSGAADIIGLFKALLVKAWTDGDFAKRPFGNSGWRYDVYIALIKAGLVEGKIDADGYLDDVDQAAADRLILQAIAALR